jgi:hypothetical protein
MERGSGQNSDRRSSASITSNSCFEDHQTSNLEIQIADGMIHVPSFGITRESRYTDCETSNSEDRQPTCLAC